MATSEAPERRSTLVRWLKRSAPKTIRDRWTVSALPMADPDGRSRGTPFAFPPTTGFYEDAELPESRYVWRWVTYQAPDLVVELRGAPSATEAADSLAAALRSEHAAGLGSTPAVVLPVSATQDDLASALSRVTTRSPMHAAMAARSARPAMDIARVLARRYPATPSISYIPALSWINTLKLSALIGDESLRTKVLAQVQPWLSGEKPLLGDRIQLTTVAGTMVFAELARSDVCERCGAKARARRRRRGTEGERQQRPAVRPGLDRRHVHGLGDPRAAPHRCPVAPPISTVPGSC